MRNLQMLAAVASAGLLAFMIIQPVGASHDAPGFDDFGYNYKAKVFVGVAGGVDRDLDGTMWGDPIYANDHLVMKWSRAWDEARFRAQPGPLRHGWTTNGTGRSPDGSGETWHYKVIWVGPDLESSPHWRPGGYAI